MIRTKHSVLMNAVQR